MNIKLGPAISSKSSDYRDLIAKLEFALSTDDAAIELSLTRPQKMKYEFNDKVFDLLRKFEYRSIHAPINDPESGPIRYPSAHGEALLSIVDKIIEAINPYALLFHPDVVDDFDYLSQRYSDILAFENMDAGKSFGKTIEDMRFVFAKAQNARWVFDINHLYTNDRSMNSANDWFTAFGDRLTHYHISSLGSFHDCFCITHEDIILNGIVNLKFPMIHEGRPIDKGVWQEEREYIINRLSAPLQSSDL